MPNKKFLLMILDGWGIGKKDKADAIFNGDTPNIDRFTTEYPNSYLLTSGEDVGLPEGQMGNSEVGHLNIGAGRVVYQDLVKINKAIKDNSISENKVLFDAYKYAKENNKDIHLIGLVSDGGVHSSVEHLYKLCDLGNDFGVDNIFIHALMDGRDTDPRSGVGYMGDLQQHLEKSRGKVASICGRYYTMDRDKRWERIKKGYDLLVHGIGDSAKDPVEAIKESYAKGVTDEFIKPIAIKDSYDKPIATIKEDDVVICFNFRTDRLREITTVLTQKDFPEFDMKTMNLYYLTMTSYDDTFKNIKVIYEKDNVKMTLGEYISSKGLKQLRIAETEKYAHVTFFLSGGREKVFDGESRILIQSPKVATYDLKPEMSAYEVKDALIKDIKENSPDLICLNFANGDMVGHTGVLDSIMKAVHAVDDCVGQVVKVARENAYDIMIIADHGNSDHAVNEDGSPNTAHSLNPVPCILISDDYKKINPGILADVAPTILKIMGLEQPSVMTGKALV